MLILSNQEVEEALPMEICMDALEQAFLEYAKGEAIGLPRYDTSVSTSFEKIAERIGVSAGELFRRIPEGEVAPEALKEEPVYRFKTQVGAVPAMATLALRLNSDIVAFPNVGGLIRQYKLPLIGGYHYCGMVFLFSTVDGEPLALFPDGQLGRMRVGGTTGLGIKWLARKDASVVGLLGAGWQAGAQVTAAACARKVREVRVYSPTSSRRENFSRQMTDSLKIPVRPVGSAKEAVEGADIVLAATNSLTPVLEGAWLAPGCHVGAIATPEIDRETYSRASVIVLTTRLHMEVGDRIDYVLPALEGRIPLKKDHGQVKDRLSDLEKIPELAEIVVGSKPGRTNENEITVHMNNSFSIQFAAVGAKVLELARKKGLGREIPTDWFLQDVHT
ncbi:MAG: ornithine cyclodeaminase family protein [Deltaproteobacteria bacterium]|nr:ornithine cyclodeaminase family protein [Deltaproteobacteria bacterium]